jgi:hypothetical protein
MQPTYMAYYVALAVFATMNRPGFAGGHLV